MFTRIKRLFASKALPLADESRTYKTQGDELLKLDRLDDAAGCYRRAVSISPDFVEACVGLGFALSAQKQYREAEEHLRHALSIDPATADAHYILGTISKSQDDHVGSIDHFTHALEVKPDFEIAYRDLFAALFQSGEIQKAKDILGRAISIYPESAEFHFYLGNLLSHEEDYDNAVPCYQRALAIQPDSAESHKNLADVLFKRGEVDQAIACYELAVTLKPQYAGAQIGLGNVLQNQGRFDDALACFRRAVALEPEFAAAHQYLGNALVNRGATQEAVACFEEVVRLEPENAVKHLIAALSGRDSERAPSDYVEKLFDEYAHKFDSHLVETLNYNVPEKLAKLLSLYSDPNDKRWTILDLGCGTGLSGAAIAPYARQLVGVDLSAKMLEKARERNVYHRLEHMDLLTMMEGEAASSCDVVFAADVLIYLGKLDELVTQAYRLLLPGGLFAFSVESLEALTDGTGALSERRDYQLNITGRYTHSISYLARIAEHNGFEVVSIEDTQVRRDKGASVEGYLALWRRPPI